MIHREGRKIYITCDLFGQTRMTFCPSTNCQRALDSTEDYIGKRSKSVSRPKIANPKTMRNKRREKDMELARKLGIIRTEKPAESNHNSKKKG